MIEWMRPMLVLAMAVPAPLLVAGCSGCQDGALPGSPTAPVHTGEPGSVERGSDATEDETAEPDIPEPPPGSPLRGWVKSSDSDGLLIVDAHGRERHGTFIDGAQVVDHGGRARPAGALSVCQTVTIAPTTIEVLDEEPGAAGDGDQERRNGYEATVSEVDFVGSTLVVARGRRTEHLTLDPDTTYLTRNGEPIVGMEGVASGQRVRVEPMVVTIESAPEGAESGAEADDEDGFYRGRVTARYTTTDPRGATGIAIEVGLDGGESITLTFDLTERSRILERGAPAEDSAVFECRRVRARPRTLVVLEGGEAAVTGGSFDARVVGFSRDDFRVLLEVDGAEQWSSLRAQTVVTRGASTLAFRSDPFRKMELLRQGDRVRVTPLELHVLP